MSTSLFGSRAANLSVLSILLVLVAPAAVEATSPCTFSAQERRDHPPNIEYQFYCDAEGMESPFHFGTLIVEPTDGSTDAVAPVKGRLIFRSHPDRADPNGWGTSWYMNPFLAGADPDRGVVDSVVASGSGIAISASGEVSRESATEYGTWHLEGSMAYDPAEQRVFGSGDVSIHLDGTLAAAGADLNLDRLSSNFLQDVPLVGTGASGDTGDMKECVVRYAASDDPRDFIWSPPDRPEHYPQDVSRYLELEIVGALNAVDTAAQGFEPIEVARKPTVGVTYTSATEEMIAGLRWDETQGQEYTADNIGINHLLTREHAPRTELELGFAVESTVPGVSVPPCRVGDCSNDVPPLVQVDEIVTMVNVALGRSDASTCAAGDANGDKEITVEEIIAAVHNALTGCGS